MAYVVIVVPDGLFDEFASGHRAAEPEQQERANADDDKRTDGERDELGGADHFNTAAEQSAEASPIVVLPSGMLSFTSPRSV